MPLVSAFGPEKRMGETEILPMTVEEYETVRLIDLEGLSQEESAKAMGVARSTVQRIYGEARRKIADCLVHGKTLKIAGGSYRVCGEQKSCGCCACRRAACSEQEQEDGTDPEQPGFLPGDRMEKGKEE